MIQVKEEIMRKGFVKHHLQGLPFNAVIHELSADDIDIPHSHPWGFRSFILEGEYIERRYIIDPDGFVPYLSYEITRKKGESFSVDSNNIHEIISIPSGKVYTLILPNTELVDWGFYRFEDDKVYYRQHNQNDWTQIL